MNLLNETGAFYINDVCNETTLYRSQYLSPYDITLHLTFMLLGLLTHSCVIWLIIKGTERELATEFFTLNISICETVLCFRSVNSLLSNKFEALWKLRIFLTGIVTTARLFQVLMCFERYMAVVHPVIFLKYKALRYKVACSIAIWIMIFVCGGISLEITNNCLFHTYKGIYTLHFIGFLFINMFCCFAVLKALRKPGPGKKEENQMKRRAFNLILITTVTLIVTYVPSSITSIQYVLLVPASIELESFSLTCFLLPGFVQPLLFIHRSGKLPFCKKKSRKNDVRFNMKKIKP